MSANQKSQKERDLPVIHAELIPIGEVHRYKSVRQGRPDELVGGQGLFKGHVGWVDVPGESERRYVYFCPEVGCYRSPESYFKAKEARAVANIRAHPWSSIKHRLDSAYHPRVPVVPVMGMPALRTA